ncbi:dTDP-glucose 4,6-dehydratase [Streptomyces sp. NBC_01304]|uniref:dTDP-glucose 4,6-dehydratase n=1 Tax=Streptomyces sp. NBC_01304 TaxID=2903818 RepID=UPI002E1136E8|nr:dTDP-glucose 4,6-dehydratase [Streptomyces sp. NBC_01304]
MNLLVTGGAGFIGSAFVRGLLDGRHPGHERAEVTVLDKLTYAGNPANLPLDHPRLRFVQGDLCDARLVDELLPGHEAVVHFAAESHVDRSLLGAEQFVLSNVLGTHHLLEASARHAVARVVHVSTDEVYGSTATGAWDEQCPLAPTSPYAVTKAASDLFAQSHWRTSGLEVVTTRCSNNYGPRQHPEKLIPRFVTTLLDGGQVPLYGDGLHVREWLHVEDHCHALRLVLDKGRPGEVYHVGGGTELTNRDLTTRLLDLCGADRASVRHVPDRKGHDRRYALDDTKLREELGYRPEVDFDEGLAAVVDWYRDNRDWWQPRHPPES